jgi:predicted TIM-barrel fold metal-dependent hydrolase
VVFVDAHTHLFAPEQRDQRLELCARDSTFADLYTDPAATMAPAPDLAGAMREASIEKAVIAGFAFASERDLAEQWDYLAHAAKESAGRFAVVAPISLSLPGWEREVNAMISGGARGFGELRPSNQGWDPLGTDAHRFYSMANEAGSVLLWHTSEPVGHAYPGKDGGITPQELWQVAVRHPGLRMIGAHMGGGLPFYAHMPEVKAAIENIYFDTAASALLYDEDCIARVVDLVGESRVLFGSDYPLLSPRRQIKRVQTLLPGGVAQAVCGGNADTLFWELNDT